MITVGGDITGLAKSLTKGSQSVSNFAKDVTETSRNAQAAGKGISEAFNTGATNVGKSTGNMRTITASNFKGINRDASASAKSFTSSFSLASKNIPVTMSRNLDTVNSALTTKYTTPARFANKQVAQAFKTTAQSVSEVPKSTAKVVQGMNAIGKTTGSVSKVAKEIGNVGKTANNAGVQGVRAFSNVNKVAMQTSNSTADLVRNGLKLTGVFAVLGSIKSLTAQAVSRFDTMQKFPKVLEALGFTASDSTKSINRLSEGIDGLPTTLDEVVASTQQMTAITGDLDRSTETVLALNNAFLASGASTMDASRGVQQFNQMMSTGVVDLEAWKTLQETMPLALQKTAEAMGFTGKTAQRDLYSALKKGKITFDDFQNSLVKLGTGTGMLASLAKENSLGIATSFGNLANAIAKGMANILTKLDALTKKFTGKSIAQNIDSLKAGINSFFAAAVSGMDKLDALFSYIQKHGELFKTLAVGALAAVSALVAFRIAMTTIAAVSGAAKTISLVAFAFTNVRKEVGLAKAAMIAFNVATGANPLVFLITLLIGVTAALAFFFTKTKTGQKIVQDAWGAIKSVVETTVNALKVALQATGAFFERVGVAIKAGFLRALEDSNSALSKFVSFCQQVGAALKSAFGTSIDFVVSLFNKLKESLGGATSGAISGIVTLLDRMGGAFGVIGGVASIVVGILSKVALAFLGLTGGLGLAVALLISFATAWAKTGKFNADGITEVFDNLSATIDKVATYLTSNLPKFIAIGTELITNFINGITKSIPKIVSAVSSITDKFSSTLSAVLPQIITMGTNLLVSLVNGIVKAIPKITSVVLKIIETYVSTMTTLLPLILNAGLQILTTLVAGITQALPAIIEAALSILTALFNGIIAALPVIIGIGLQIITMLVGAIVKALPTLLFAGITIITTLLDVLVTNLPLIIGAGIQILIALISGINKIVPQLIMAGIQLIMALLGALISALPKIIDAGIQLVMALISGLIKILPQLINAAIKLLLAVVKAIITNLPKIIEAGVKLVLALISGLLKILPQLIKAAITLAVELIKAIIKFAPQILSAGVQLIWALIKGILSLVGQLVVTAVKLMSQLMAKIRSYGAQMLAKGAELIARFIVGIWNKSGEVVSKIGDVVTKMIKSIGGFFDSMNNAGKDLVRGFINGIGSMIGDVTRKAKEMADGAVSTVKKFLHIGSPSKVLHQIGVWTGEGLYNGIDKMIRPVMNITEKLADAATPNMNAIQTGLSTDMSSSISGAVSASVSASSPSNAWQDRLAARIDALGDRLDGMSVQMEGKQVGRVLAPHISEQEAQQQRQQFKALGKQF